MWIPDLTLSDLLDEPIVRAMMAADAIDSAAIRVLFSRLASGRHPPSREDDAARGGEAPATAALHRPTKERSTRAAVPSLPTDRRSRSNRAPIAVGSRPEIASILDARSRKARPMPDRASQASSARVEASPLEPDLQVLLEAFRRPPLHVRDLRQPEPYIIGATHRSASAPSSRPTVHR